jgi:hypothetical protein
MLGRVGQPQSFLMVEAQERELELERMRAQLQGYSEVKCSHTVSIPTTSIYSCDASCVVYESVDCELYHILVVVA